MNLKPILRANLQKYIEDFELKNLSEDEAFERFVNYQILSESYPGVFENDSELLDLITVGGGNDLGFDGIAISLNDRLIRSKEDIDDLLSIYNKARFEITLIQSKNREKLELGEFMKFTNGIVELLNDTITSPANGDIIRWHDILQYILSDNIIIKWDSDPIVNTIYVTSGKWDNNQHFLGHEKTIRGVIDDKGCFIMSKFRYVDAVKLTSIVKSNASRYELV